MDLERVAYGPERRVAERWAHHEHVFVRGSGAAEHAEKRRSRREGRRGTKSRRAIRRPPHWQATWGKSPDVFGVPCGARKMWPTDVGFAGSEWQFAQERSRR